MIECLKIIRVKITAHRFTRKLASSANLLRPLSLVRLMIKTKAKRLKKINYLKLRLLILSKKINKYMIFLKFKSSRFSNCMRKSQRKIKKQFLLIKQHNISVEVLRGYLFKRSSKTILNIRMIILLKNTKKIEN